MKDVFDGQDAFEVPLLQPGQQGDENRVEAPAQQPDHNDADRDPPLMLAQAECDAVAQDPDLQFRQRRQRGLGHRLLTDRLCSIHAGLSF